ncbi:MAG TPA: SPOR domain-containing protein [Dongiaceae bacterium]|nr:SPOR domain-containing protein [Dongiaceae bacterium]
MEQNLKQRLVGALVLISLAVIFLPLVFDRQQQRIDTEPYSIPEKPALTLKSVDIEPLEQTAQEDLAKVTAVAKEKQEQEEAAVQMQVDAEATSPEAANQTSPQTPAQTPAQPATQSTATAAKSNPPVPKAGPSPEVAAYIEQEKKVDQALQTAPQSQTVNLADAWIIQVGAFSSQPNAEGLRDKLKAGGYPAFVKPIKVASGQMFKVYVGPEIRRHMVDQQKQQLEQKYQLKALILKYIP